MHASAFIRCPLAGTHTRLQSWSFQLHRIGIGRTHAGTHILLLVQDLNIRIINTATGELLRDLTLNPDRIYQPTGKPPGPPPGTPRPPRKARTMNP